MMWMIDQSVLGNTTATTSNSTKEEGIDDVEMMGLLYGIITDNNSTVSIVDAEEIPTSTSQGIQTKIELHQKVFPSHKVVGWYRICSSNSNTSEPTQNDLEISTTGWIQKYTKTPLFLFFHPQQQNQQNPDENDDLDESLPCILYDTTSSVFLHLEFEMTTLDPERIAIESVISSCSSMQKKNKKNKHNLSSKSSITTTTNIKEPSKDSTKPNVKQQEQEQQQEEQETLENDYHLESLKGSMEAFNARLEIVQEFLQQTYSQKIPTNYHLLRQVNSLLDLLFQHDQQNDNKEYQHMMVVSHLAIVAKTTFAIQNYTEKYRKVATMAHMGNTNTVSSSGSSKTKGHHLNPWRTVGGNAEHPYDTSKIT